MRSRVAWRGGALKVHIRLELMVKRDASSPAYRNATPGTFAFRTSRGEQQD